MRTLENRFLLALLLGAMIALAGCMDPDDEGAGDDDVGGDPGADGGGAGEDGMTGTPGPDNETGTSEDNPANGNLSVRMGEFFFEPEEVWITNGTTVEWTNEGTVVHTATATGANATWDTGDVFSGESANVTFDETGTHEYACQYHIAQGMTGTIHVVEREDEGLL